MKTTTEQTGDAGSLVGTMSKIRPIIFTGDAVPKIIAGLKTQDRRVIIPQPVCMPMGNTRWHWHRTKRTTIIGSTPKELAKFMLACCPYGVPGDKLWVRESLRRSESGVVTYKADCTPVWRDGESVRWPWKVRTLAARSMPRWASRLTLTITDVRVQRVHDISFADCRAEGCDEAYREEVEPCPQCTPSQCSGAHYGEKWHFARVWDSRNAKRGHGWDVNDRVWATSFEKD